LDQGTPLPFFQEQFPPGDTVRVANERDHQQFLWSAGHGERLEAGFVRQTIALADVHVLARSHEVLARTEGLTVTVSADD